MIKRCHICKEYKDTTEFHKNKSRKDGLDGRCKKCNTIHQRKFYYKSYGITLGIYNKMYEKQRGKCLFCKRGYKILCVDHDHKTGKVRGLLCRKCNYFLGIIKDDPEVLRVMIKYLEIAY